MRSLLIKRLIDTIASVIGLLLAAPLILVAACLIWFSMGRPIMFVQTRPGLKGRPFKMLKLRTMTGPLGKDGTLLSKEQRVTPLGRFLRSASIDELPELWNVLKGDMSLVGPRPLLIEYLDRYTPEQSRRHQVKPGLTGLAQVSGRNNTTWEERFAWDVWYVDHWTVGLDIKILALTIRKVLLREGIVPDGQSFMPEFKGSRQIK